MKNKEKIQLKEYEKGFHKACGHHLLQSLRDMARIIPTDPNNAKDFNFSKESFLLLSVKGDTHADIYINKSKKAKEDEWAFVFATAFIVLAFNLYGNRKVSNLLQEKSIILFSTDYVFRVLGFTEIPFAWSGYIKLADQIHFKNEDSVFNQIKENNKFHELTFNFLNHEESSIRPSSSIVNLTGNSTNTFAEQFAYNLVTQAKRTIALKANKNISEAELELRKTPLYKAKIGLLLTIHY